MVGIGTRWNRTHRHLLNLRNGPGAAILPPTISKIHLQFAANAEGHIGANKLWKGPLRRLKYHNPSVPMIINRLNVPTSPGTLTLYFRDAASADAPETRVQPPSSLKGDSPAQPPSVGERIVEIDVQGKRGDFLLQELIAETKAQVLETPEKDQEDLRKFKEMDSVAEVQREKERKIREEENKAKAMLRRAKAGAGA